MHKRSRPGKRDFASVHILGGKAAAKEVAAALNGCLFQGYTLTVDIAPQEQQTPCGNPGCPFAVDAGGREPGDGAEGVAAPAAAAGAWGSAPQGPSGPHDPKLAALKRKRTESPTPPPERESSPVGPAPTPTVVLLEKPSVGQTQPVTTVLGTLSPDPSDGDGGKGAIRALFEIGNAVEKDVVKAFPVGASGVRLLASPQMPCDA